MLKNETEQKARQVMEFRPAVAKIMIFSEDGTYRAKGITPDQTEHLKKQLNSPRNNNNNSSSKNQNKIIPHSDGDQSHPYRYSTFNGGMNE